MCINLLEQMASGKNDNPLFIKIFCPLRPHQIHLFADSLELENPY